MKHVLRLIAVGFVLPMVSMAQIGLPKEPNWNIFSQDDEPFVIEVPIILKTDKSPDNSWRRSSGELNGTYFFVFSEKAKKANVSKFIMQFARSFTPTEKIETHGQPAVESISFKDDEGFYQKFLSFTLNDRSYIFHGISRQDNDPLVKRFFDSLKVDKQPLVIASNPVNESTSLPPEKIEPGRNISSGTGSGYSGMGTGSGSGNSQDSPVTTKSPVSATPFKILSKPKASYTEMARVYEISGNVRLKVTLLANGTVGSVVPISYLPMGLTKSAMQAAKSVRFEPKTINGVPVSVVVTFDYGFSLF